MFTRLVRLLAIAGVVSLAAFIPVTDLLFAQPERAQRKVAFLVGVSKYEYGFENLKYAERDAEELGKALKAGGFEVVVLTGSGVGKDKATKKNFEARLKAVLDGDGDDAKKVKKGDIVLVSLSGHGQQIFVPDPADPKKMLDDAFFCPTDGKPGEPETLISISHLVDKQLAPCGSRNLLLIDACRDIVDGKKGVEGRDIALKGETAVLFSCARGETSVESATVRHGVFTYAVLKGLKAGTGAGVVTWTSLTGAVEEEMASDDFKKLLPSGHTQTPVAPRGQFPRTVLLAAGKQVVPKTDPGGADIAKDETEEEFEYQIEDVKKKGKRRVLKLNIGGGEVMEFVRIGKGTFQMGAPAGEKEAGDDEKPQHKVEIAKDFYLGKYTVTQAQYKAITGETPSTFKGDRLPVETVWWDDAVKFCELLTKKVKRSVVLPTEAQWEYACRAGTTTPFHFGSKLNGDFANCNGKIPYGTETTGVNKEETVAVGSYPANPWGLYDMHGNVCQWCRDYYGPYDTVKEADGGSPVQLEKQSLDSRVLRGGCWDDGGRFCRAAYRYGTAPGSRNRLIGFRVCLPLD